MCLQKIWRVEQVWKWYFLQSHPDRTGTNELSLSFQQWLQLPSSVPLMALNGQWLPHADLDGSMWIMECLHKIWISHRWQLCQWSQQNHLPSWAMAEMMAVGWTFKCPLLNYILTVNSWKCMCVYSAQWLLIWMPLQNLFFNLMYDYGFRCNLKYFIVRCNLKYFIVPY